ncbi:hypothetical protein P170DRAFT_161481 [Aspergillus steynii IBT 23096]|uniref:Uncharacterized protein n=1 Tax=Aspergillus steynii IBT 23096 TaxID=1392250 RepID=A0A2I2GE78_9EURO|nr:uncharacterized protein P170DRAFT_161481 [Aspergillus steynii IBT 23096]PLB51162.1 hypothetical protein P170DRAFT_161481 [Aspergillus steynii IBT 23096]
MIIYFLLFYSLFFFLDPSFFLSDLLFWLSSMVVCFPSQSCNRRFLSSPTLPLVHDLFRRAKIPLTCALSLLPLSAR